MDGLILKLVIKFIFEKVIDEVYWFVMYVKFCKLLYDEISFEVFDIIDGKLVVGCVFFCRYLFGCCQVDFEVGWKVCEDIVVVVVVKKEEDGVKQEEVKDDKDKEVVFMSDEYYVVQKVKCCGLGFVQFIGEFFKREMIFNRVIKECLFKLFSNIMDFDEEDIELVCKFFIMIGVVYD